MLLNAFRDGGPFMYLILMLGLPLTAVTLVLVGLRFSGRRIPGYLWFVGPAVISLFGLFGFTAGIYQTMKAATVASPDMASTLIAAGTAVAPLPDQLGLIFVSLALGLATVGLGLAVRTTAASTDRSHGRAAAAMGIGILGALGIFVFSGESNPMAAPTLAAAVLAAAAAVAMVADVAPSADEHHLAAESGLVASLGLAAVAALGALWVSIDKALIYKAIFYADVELHEQFLSAGLDALGSTMAMGLVAVVFTSALIPVALLGRLHLTRARWGYGAAIAGILLAVVCFRASTSLKAQHDLVVSPAPAAESAEPSGH